MRNQHRRKLGRGQEQGFTLIETLIAILVLSIGVLGLAATFAAGLTYITSSQDDFIAQQKAEQAMESIFAARDNGLAFSSIANTSNGGIFTTGASQLCNAGPDGIIGTTDDLCGAANLDCIETPNSSGVLGGPGSKCITLTNFKRTIAIAPVAGSTGLESITVTMNYTAGRLKRTYQLESYISSAF
jgi:type IV pilus modification protein PilV